MIFKGGQVSSFESEQKVNQSHAQWILLEIKLGNKMLHQKKKGAYKSRNLISHMACELNISEFVKNQCLWFMAVSQTSPHNTRAGDNLACFSLSCW